MTDSAEVIEEVAYAEIERIEDENGDTPFDNSLEVAHRFQRDVQQRVRRMVRSIFKTYGESSPYDQDRGVGGSGIIRLHMGGLVSHHSDRPYLIDLIEQAAVQEMQAYNDAAALVAIAFSQQQEQERRERLAKWQAEWDSKTDDEKKKMPPPPYINGSASGQPY